MSTASPPTAASLAASPPSAAPSAAALAAPSAPPLAALLAAGTPVPAHRPWPRAIVDAGTWETAALHAAQGALTLLSLWAETGVAHMALFDPQARSAAVLSLDCPEGRFPSVGALHPPAIRLERAIRDLFGMEPVGLADDRPWLDHGRWGDEARPATAYRFLPVSGDGLHRIPVGPIHAGIIEPGHFRFTCDGETVVRLEQRLGYVHKGIDRLMTDAPLDRAAALAGRVSGDSTVAYALAFALAAEAATGTEPPPRAVVLRAVMAELERIANHIGDFGAICNDAAFSLMLAHCGVLRERVLRASAVCFGHRLMMDRIVPGGVAADPDSAGLAAVRAVLERVTAELPPLVKMYDTTTSLQDRTVSTGHVRPELASRFGAGGYVGRASGRDFDARRDLAYAPYAGLGFEVPVLVQGDVNARVWIRLKEIDESVRLVTTLLDSLPAGPVSVPLAGGDGEGMALVEAFRGDVLAWLRLEGGLVRRCHLRDASWFQWPLLEAAIEGNIVADFPLCNKSFNCSYSGHDL